MTVVLATSLSLLCLVTMWLLCRHRLPRSHTWRQKSARRVLLRLTDVRFNPAQKLTYLRALDPWVFEEVVVTALKRRGMAVEPQRATPATVVQMVAVGIQDIWCCCR